MLLPTFLIQALLKMNLVTSIVQARDFNGHVADCGWNNLDLDEWNQSLDFIFFLCVKGLSMVFPLPFHFVAP